MKRHSTQIRRSFRRMNSLACIAALAGSFMTSLPRLVHAASHITPPPVPAILQPPEGHKVFLVGHAIGTQQYVCLSPGTIDPWAAFGPQATLFKRNGEQILTHFLSPNPLESSPNWWESGKSRPTWQNSKDSSAVWGNPIASSSDPQFVAPGAIPWLLVKVVGDQPGPTGGDNLTRATFIQRLNTVDGNKPPATDCVTVGAKALIDYEADYFFYKYGADSE